MTSNYLDDYLTLEITADSRWATLYPNRPCPRSVPKVRDVLQYLQAKGVRYGVDESAVRKFLDDWRRARVESPTIVATGDEADPDASRSTKLRRLPPPPRRGNNPVELLPLFVEKGEAIFEDAVQPKKAAIKRNVRGETLSGAGDGSLPHAGPGIEIVGKKWISRRAGFLTQENGKVIVSTSLIQPRDLPSGTYDWPNDVVIQGNIAPNTVLESGGDVWVQGSVFDSVKIVAGGTIRVEGEVVGAETQLVASGDIVARAVTNARLTADGDIRVQDRVRMATLRTYGRFCGMSEDGQIIGSRVGAVKGAEIASIASCRTQATHISVGVPDWLDDSYKDLQAEIVRWQSYHQKIYEDFQRRHDSLLSDRAKIHRLPSKEKEQFEADQEAVLQEQKRVDEKIAKLKTKQARLQERRQRDDKAIIVLLGKTAAGARFTIRGKTYAADRELGAETTLFVSPESGRVHAIPSSLFQSSEFTT